MNSVKLLEHPIFRGADEVAISSVLKRCRPQPLCKGQLVVEPDSKPYYVHLLLEGRLHSYLITSSGDRLLLEVVQPGGIDGLLSMTGHRGHFTEAVEPSMGVCLSYETLSELNERDPRVGINLLDLALARLERREEHLDALAHRRSGGRLARQLRLLAEHCGVAVEGGICIPLVLTHRDIADMVCLRRETVSIELGRLERAGGVFRRGRHYAVRPDVLRRIEDQ